MIKALFLDLDGTLLIKDISAPNEYRIKEENITALRRLQDNNVKIITASGRMYRFTVVNINQDLGFNFDAIASNGAMVVCENKTIDFQACEGDKLLAVAEFLLDYPLTEAFIVNDKDDHYFMHPGGESWQLINKRILKQRSGSVSDLSIKDVALKPEYGPFLKMCVISPEYQTTNMIAELLKERFSEKLEISVSADIYVELVAKGADKGTGVSKVCEYYGYKYDEIAAIGDSFNDLSMFELTTNSFVMEHALPEIKKQANFCVKEVADMVDIIIKINQKGEKMTEEVRKMIDFLDKTPNSLQAVKKRREEVFAAVKDIKLAPDSRLYLVASGSSGEGLRIASFLWEQVLGKKPYVVSPYQFNNYPQSVNDKDLVLSLSQTGTSHEVVEALRTAKKAGAKTLGITTIADTPITKEADVALVFPEGIEDNDYKVVGVVVGILAVLLVAYGLALANGISWDIEADLAKLDEVITRYPANVEVTKNWVEKNFVELNKAKGFVVIGSGPAQEVAEELSIKITEVTNKITCHLDTEEYLHGVCAIVDPDYYLIIITGHENHEFSLMVYEAADDYNKKVIWLGPDAPEGQISLQKSKDPVYAAFDGMAAVHSFVSYYGKLGEYGDLGTDIFAYYQERMQVRE